MFSTHCGSLGVGFFFFFFIHLFVCSEQKSSVALNQLDQVYINSKGSVSILTEILNLTRKGGKMARCFIGV